MKSLKSKVSAFITDLVHTTYIDNEVMSPKTRHFYFKIVGFCDEPEVFIVAIDEGLAFGTDAFIWDGPAVPLPVKNIYHSLGWEMLNELDSEGRKDKIVEMMLKNIATKKREYWTCQLCEKKMHRTEFYDKKTCIQCAESKLRKYKNF